MEYFVTKEQVVHILKAHGHQVVMDSSFVVGHPISEIEAIVDVCDVIAKVAYDQGVKDATERHIDLQNQMTQRVDELTEFNRQLKAENKDLCEKVESLTKKNQNLFNNLQDTKKAAYHDGRQDAIAEYGKDWYQNEMSKLSEELAPKPEINEAQELEHAIETIQVALSGSFRDNLKIEVTEQHAWLVYGNMKFLIEPMEAWQAVQSCVYLSGLEVDDE